MSEETLKITDTIQPSAIPSGCFWERAGTSSGLSTPI
jgi:hypothetical protein